MGLGGGRGGDFFGMVLGRGEEGKGFVDYGEYEGNRGGNRTRSNGLVVIELSRYRNYPLLNLYMSLSCRLRMRSQSEAESVDV